MKSFLVTLLLIALSTAALAIDPLPFADREQELRFQALVAELRCLVCQNQNLADSDAELAKDLRNEVFELMQAGKTDAQIKTFMIERYGDFVLYKPPLQSNTLLLWFGPALILLIGLISVIVIVRKNAKALPANARGEEDLP